jgi:hypothetical protein
VNNLHKGDDDDDDNTFAVHFVEDINVELQGSCSECDAPPHVLRTDAGRPNLFKGGREGLIGVFVTCLLIPVRKKKVPCPVQFGVYQIKA